MKLYLVRHGDAVPMVDDDKRPLSIQGRHEAENAGLLLKTINAKPAFIFHSTLLRGIETAQIIADVLGCDEQITERFGLLPEDTTDHWVSELSTESQNCLIVGHLPFLPALASVLLTGSEDDIAFKFSTGSVLCLEREGYGVWSMRHFITSKIIRVLLGLSQK